MADSINQLGTPGASLPSALGTQFSYAQIRGPQTPAVEPSTILSTVQLSQVGDLIFATPGTSFVDIGLTETGENVQYIKFMGGNTNVNNELVAHNGITIPSGANLSINPELGGSVTQVNINADINIGTGNAVFPNVIINPSEFEIRGASAINMFGMNVDISGSGLTTVSGLQLDLLGSIVDISGVTTMTGPVTINSNVTINGTTTMNGDTVTTSDTVEIYTGTYSNFCDNVVSHTSNQNSNYAGRHYIVADGGINPAYEGYINMISCNGYQGRINMDAYAGFEGFTLGGMVTINAWGSDNPLLNTGGLITLNAYSGPFGEYGGFASAIRLNAASIGLSAGSVMALPGTPGATNIYGQGLVSIVSAPTPPAFLQTPESVYLYGTGGVTMNGGLLGIYHKGDAYFGNSIQPDNFSYALNITSNTVTSAPVIISGLSSINNIFAFNGGNISGISSINGVAYPYPDPSSINVSAWSQYPQLYTLSTFIASTITATNNLTVNDTATITNANITNLTGGSGPVPAISVNSEFEMNFHSIRDVASLYVGAYIYNDSQIWTPSLRGGRGINGPTDYNLNIEPGLDAYMQPNRDLILRPSGVLEIQNLSSINGVAYPQAVNGWVSTANTQLNMSLYDIVSTQRITANNATLIGTLTTANVNATGNVNVSSINNAVYPPPAPPNSWVGTATSALNMNGNSIYGATTVSASGQISANNFITASVAVNTGNITIGGTTLDSGGLSASGVTLSYANVSGNVQAGSLTNVVSINGTKTFSLPNVNQYISAGVTGIYYRAVSPGTINIQSSTATGGGDLSVQVDIFDVDNLPGTYRFVNANAVNNMNIQFTTVGTDGVYHNWGQNTQLNPGQSILCRVWYSNYQGRYVITNFQKDDNPSPSN